MRQWHSIKAIFGFLRAALGILVALPALAATTPFVARALYLNGGRMRIAQVAPLIESVPPKTYGGTERI
ncbi:MAG: hypothetical protein WCF76_18900, partial [Pseudolabrys sp.]